MRNSTASDLARFARSILGGSVNYSIYIQSKPQTDFCNAQMLKQNIVMH